MLFHVIQTVHRNLYGLLAAFELRCDKRHDGNLISPSSVGATV